MRILTGMESFSDDILQGLRSTPKYLPPKYFYDEAGDRLFQQIMHSPEYYLTRCEYEIFSRKAPEIADLLQVNLSDFDLVELGAGNCYKSRFLLAELVRRRFPFTFYPVDISSNVIRQLNQTLPVEIPGLQLHGLNGEYLRMLERAQALSDRPKVVLFLGANIGNLPKDKTGEFLQKIHSVLNPGDLVCIGFDLKKDPDVILAAYNDAAGLTREFNLNLLRRINRELDADFDLAGFKHFPVYDPVNGACRSYLISLRQQQVHLKSSGEHIAFEPFEPVFMEVSQKYATEEIPMMAQSNGFQSLTIFYDDRNWFGDAVWRVEK